MPICQDLYYFLHAEGKPGSLPLVLIHGAAGTHLFWPPELRRLPGRTVLALDLPGHGKSANRGGLQRIEAYAEEISDCLRKLDIPRAVIAGHSMGGAVALTLAVAHPELISGLILISSGARLQVNPSLLANAASATSFPQAVHSICRWSFSDQAPERLVQLAEQRMAEVRPSVLHADLQACASFSANGSLAGLRCPTLVLCGSKDQMTPPHLSQYLADTIPGAQIQLFPGAGHMLMLEQPRPVTEAVQSFCQTLAVYPQERI